MDQPRTRKAFLISFLGRLERIKAREGKLGTGDIPKHAAGLGRLPGEDLGGSAEEKLEEQYGVG